MRCWIQNKVPQFWMSLRSNHCIAWSYLPRSQQLWLDYIKYVETEDIARKHKHLYSVSGRGLFPELNEIVNEAGCKRKSGTMKEKDKSPKVETEFHILREMTTVVKILMLIKCLCWYNNWEKWEMTIKNRGNSNPYKIVTFATISNSHGDNSWWISWNRREILNSKLSSLFYTNCILAGMLRCTE